MENVILIIHLLLALALIGVVLMQRSEGGGLGMGGGGGGGGAMSGRSAATALGQDHMDSGHRLYLHLDHADHHRGAEIGGLLGAGPDRCGA
jgi:protein translocase SecG subunit